MIRRLRSFVEGGFAPLTRFRTWIDWSTRSSACGFKASYLPPLMIYMASGVSGLTGIVGTFFVKEHLGLSSEFFAMLGFWAGIPWALKMHMGHLVDLYWRWKSMMVFLGAGLIAVSLGIMVALLDSASWMARFMSVENWYVLSALLAPLGYVIQDVVADAMTVEAVPTVDDGGDPLEKQAVKAMHTTMQTLGRVACSSSGSSWTKSPSHTLSGF